MELFLAILAFVSLIAVSHIINRVAPFIPVPIIQIVLGIIVVMMPVDIHIGLDPELFMVLFIAPILFNDGKVTPRDELWKLRAPILLLAVGLVFITVIIGGYTVHAMVPTIPLAAAFGLAAILSPTDAVAVSAISARVHLPKRIHRLLEGESLMNDASGLVAFKFAIAATVTGVFSLWQASISFVIIAVGGLLFGALLAFAIIWVRALLRRYGMEDVAVHMMIVIVTPFLLYILAEELGLSGILAAVAGGIVHAVERDRSRNEEIELRVVSDSTWSVILFILNGFVFIMLGLQIPSVMDTIFQDFAHNNFRVVSYVVLLYLLLLAIRFTWLFLSNRFTVAVAGPEANYERTSWLSIILLSVSGVRGTLTLAGAFSIPLVLDNGEAFPERDLIIFLAAGVILLSLIVASIALPLLAGKTSQSADGMTLDPSNEALKKAILAAIQSVQLARNSENELAATAIVSSYNQKLFDLDSTNGNIETSSHLRREEIKIRRMAVDAERQCLSKFLQNGEVRQEDARRLKEVLAPVEMVLTNRRHLLWMLCTRLISKLWSTVFPSKSLQVDAITAEDRIKLRQLRLRTARSAIEAIKNNVNDNNKAASYRVLSRYNRKISELRKQLFADNGDARYEEQRKILQLGCIQAERNELQALYEKSQITRKQLYRLQMMVSYREADIIEESMEEH